VIVEPVDESTRPLAVSYGGAHDRQPGLRCAANDREAPTTQRSMFFSRSLRSAAAMNPTAALLALGVDLRTRTSKHSRVIALQTGHRCCTSRKRFSSSRLDVFDPYLVVTTARECLRPLWSDVTTELPPRLRALGAGFHGIGRIRGVQLNFTGRDNRESNCARHRYSLVLDAEDVLLSACQ